MKKRKPLKKQTQREFDISKMEYEYYSRERIGYAEEKYKNEWFLDIFIATVSVLSWLVSLGLQLFIPSFFFLITMVLIILNSYRAKQAFNESIKKLDEKDKSDNKFSKSLDDILSLKILYFFAGIISLTTSLLF